SAITDDRGLGEDEIIALDGEPAFVFAARARGAQLASREWEWDDDHLVWNASERFGEQQVADLLDRATDQRVVRFRESWQGSKTAPKDNDSPTRREAIRAIGADEVLAAACAGESDWWSFQSWGKYARRTDLLQVARHLRTVREPTALTNLDNVFLRRPIPR